MHLLLDHDEYFLVFAHITDGKTGNSRVYHDQIATNEHLSEGSILVFDRAYIDFALFRTLLDRGVFFVTRLKKGMRWYVRKRNIVPRQSNIIRDEEIEFYSHTEKVLGQHRLRLAQ